ncbi:hypothetical protein LDG_6253 [Legionella drancourtii LLAP12]|uniref:Uncharacterized protein n=2 Tax=Legionella drancourtii TaxID=168933 RepID=G9ELZ2_9GAMM|nr:hypothetical protein LDG_6253 [Legionella drancourtii LLAP12]
MFKPLMRIDLIEDTQSMLAILNEEHAKLDRMLAQEKASDDNQIKKLIFLKRRCIYFICKLEFYLTNHLYRISGFTSVLNSTPKEHNKRLSQHCLNGWQTFTAKDRS